MPLTPEDVHKKTFTPVRLREGYDMGEVDQFLDEVETELTRLYQENEDMRGKLSTAATASPAPVSAPASTQEAQAEESPAAVAPPAAFVAPAAAGLMELPVVRTVPEASSAAARLLEIAGHNADQLVDEAKADADKIIGEARTKSERLETESRSKAERLESDARTRAEKLDSETTDRRNQLFGQLERDKENLARELDELRAFEREYRTRLKGYFEGQLRALNGEGDGEITLTPAADGETPRRLRQLLGEDEHSGS
ncbi:MAG: DivIVA domain-containing protein [Nocardioidaceae bacterium]